MRGVLRVNGVIHRLLTADFGRLYPSRCIHQAPVCQAAARRGAERPKDNDAKGKVLEDTLLSLNNKYGAGSIVMLGQKPEIKTEVIPTGALTLDVALGGGLPKGRIIEIYGPESSGKSTLALQAIATVQKSGGVAVLIDAEHAFDRSYSKNMGVDVERLVVSQPDSGEQALETVDQMIRSDVVDIIVIDSVAALIPKAELEGEIGGTLGVGSLARLMSSSLRKLSGNASKHNTTVIFLNQIRHKIGVIYGSPEVTSGGQALKFFSSVRMEVRRTKFLSQGDQDPFGVKVKAKVVKNKCAAPGRVCEFDIIFASGVSTLGCLVDAAEKLEVVVRKGGWYSFNNNNIGQGRDKIIQALKDNPQLAADIEAKTREKLVSADDPDLIEGSTDLNGTADLVEEEEVSFEEVVVA